MRGTLQHLPVASANGVSPYHRVLRHPPPLKPHSRRLSLAHSLLGPVEAPQQLLDDPCQKLQKHEPHPVRGTMPHHPPRRALLAALACTACGLQLGKPQASAAEAEVATAAETSTQGLGEEFINTRQGYRLRIPSGWERKEKAGADALFEDPAKRSTSLGVTVNPVRVARIQDFGSLDVVGERLLEAERKKESTLSVAMITSSQRDMTGTSGALLYDYEYELDSTRGRKRILNTVTIYDSKLFILNGSLKCEGKGESGTACTSSTQAALDTLRASAKSFDVLPTGSK